MSAKQRLFKNTIALFFVQFSNYVAPFLIIPYLTRLLGVGGFGEVAILLSVTSILSLIVDFGFNISATPLVAQHSNNKEYINKLISAIIPAKILLALCVFILFLYFGKLTIHSEMNLSLAIAVLLVLLGQAFQSIWLFQGIEKMKFITYTVITTKLLYLVLVFILVHKQNDIDKVILALGLSNIIGGIVSVYLMYKNGFQFTTIKIKPILSQLNHSLLFFFSRASVSVYSQASVFIIGSYAGTSQAGLYAGCEKLYQGGQGALSPIIGALYPYLVKNKDTKFFFKLMALISLMLIAGVTLCIVLANWILTLILGNEFLGATHIFTIFMVLLPITYVSMNFGYPAFALINRVKLVNFTVIIGAILHLSGLIILGLFNLINAYHVVLLLLLTESIIAILRMSLFFKFYKKGEDYAAN